MDDNVYHVVPRDGQWAVKKVGAERAARVTRTKAEAVTAAKGFAQTQAPGRVIIHRLNGTIGEQLRYEEDESAGGDGETEKHGRWLSWKPATGLASAGLVLLGVAAAGFWVAKRSGGK